MLRFEEGTVTVGPESGSVSIIIRSDTQWTLSGAEDWFSYNIPKGSGSASVIFSFAKNEAGGVKSKEVVARAVDGSKTASFILRQLPSGPFIKLTPDKTAVEPEAGTHPVTLDTNLDYSQIDVAVN